MATNGQARASMVMAFGCVAAIAGCVIALARHSIPSTRRPAV
jgi:hypothetical protein